MVEDYPHRVLARREVAQALKELRVTGIPSGEVGRLGNDIRRFIGRVHVIEGSSPILAVNMRAPTQPEFSFIPEPRGSPFGECLRLIIGKQGGPFRQIVLFADSK